MANLEFGEIVFSDKKYKVIIDTKKRIIFIHDKIVDLNSFIRIISHMVWKNENYKTAFQKLFLESPQEKEEYQFEKVEEKELNKETEIPEIIQKEDKKSLSGTLQSIFLLIAMILINIMILFFIVINVIIPAVIGTIINIGIILFILYSYKKKGK